MFKLKFPYVGNCIFPNSIFCVVKRETKGFSIDRKTIDVGQPRKFVETDPREDKQASKKKVRTL